MQSLWIPPSDSPIPRPCSVGSTQSGSNISSKPASFRGKNDVCVGEELKIAVNIALERFRLSEELKECEFPSSFTSSERAYVHKLCASYGFKSKSKGKGASRYLTVVKKDCGQSSHAAATFHLVRNSRHQIHSLLQRFPLAAKERQELQQRTERNQFNESLMKEMGKATTGRLNNGVSQVPPPKLPSDLASFQQTLPVYNMKDIIIKAINDNKVMMVSGETGSGKTTQVAQMILDDCHAHNKPCRIFCTQPRRLSALTIAERVAAERGEKIGQTVGYQIRLESRVSPKTLLTFCTNGVLLRTLMAGEQSLATVTHIIVDEIHERDRFSDFLLIILREILPKMKNLKLILMSAALNVQLFTAYFNGCLVVNVPGQLFDVQEYFLEDILKWTGYTNKEMVKQKEAVSKAARQQKNLDDWCNKPLAMMSIEDQTLSPSYDINPGMAAIQEQQMLDACSTEIGPEKEELEPWLIKEMDQLLSEVWLTGKEEIFSQIFHLILSENVSVDYVHSETSVTPLMVAAGRGFLSVVEQLLNLGANIGIRSSNDWLAIDWAQKFEQSDIVELLEAHVAAMEKADQDETPLVKQSVVLSPEDKELLSVYHHSFDDEKVDIDLIICLLHKIHSLPQPGAILVFLPGYDEIITLRDRIQDDKSFSDSNRYIVYMLHSQMLSTDQKRVFKNPGSGIRKIILATNVAETSITINDVVFVIDSGKVKEKSYDAMTSVSMLKSHWISKASSLQRKGRAGRCRPGFAYHLFSRVRYNSMMEYQDPEILRYPLQELCLHTKLLAPPNCLIADFLSKAPEPPAFLITKNAVHLLKQIDALDPFEDLTELGHHLADLPVEPRYGKMILYSVVLKCLDPILTIACALAYKDPFLLASQPSKKRDAAMSRRRFSAGTFSDHMALLRAFQGWQKARSEGWERSFCERNLLSSSTMEMIVGMRTQLLGQLRAAGFVRARGGGDIRDLNSNSENWAVVKAALCAGMYPNLIRVDRERCQLTTAKENKIRFHNSSVLGPAPNEVGANTHYTAVNRLPTDWLAFEEMTRMHRTVQVRSCTAISPVTVAIFAGPAKLPLDAVRDAESGVHGGQGDGSMNDSSDSDTEDKEDGRRATLKIDDWTMFRLDSDASALIIQLRLKWHSLFLRRMRAPTKLWSQFDESTIRTVVAVLTNEEQALGLQQPAGIGQRPRPMSTETVVSSGGSRRGSATELDQADDAFCAGVGDYPQHSGAQGEYDFKAPRKEGSRSSEEKTESSSVHSSSANNSETNSLKDSPCTSPQPTSGSKWQKEDASKSGSQNMCGYFVMKAGNNKLLQASEQKGLWATSSGNEKRISKAFKEGKTVYLFFSVHGSGHFQGIARMVGPIAGERAKEFQGPNFSGTFPVEWIKKSNISFQQCQHLLNTLSDNKKVLSLSDGQEVDPLMGEQLLRMWDKLPATQSQRSPAQSQQMPMNPYAFDSNSFGQGQLKQQPGQPYWAPNQRMQQPHWGSAITRPQTGQQFYPGSYPRSEDYGGVHHQQAGGYGSLGQGGGQMYGNTPYSMQQQQQGYNTALSRSMQNQLNQSPGKGGNNGGPSSVMIMQRSSAEMNSKNLSGMK